MSPGERHFSLECGPATMLSVQVWGTKSGKRLQWSSESKSHTSITSMKLKNGFAVRTHTVHCLISFQLLTTLITGPHLSLFFCNAFTLKVFVVTASSIVLTIFMDLFKIK